MDGHGWKIGRSSLVPNLGGSGPFVNCRYRCGCTNMYPIKPHPWRCQVISLRRHPQPPAVRPFAKYLRTRSDDAMIGNRAPPPGGDLGCTWHRGWFRTSEIAPALSPPPSLSSACEGIIKKRRITKKGKVSSFRLLVLFFSAIQNPKENISTSSIRIWCFNWYGTARQFRHSPTEVWGWCRPVSCPILWVLYRFSRFLIELR